MTEPVNYWNAPRGTTMYSCKDGEFVAREDYARLEQDCERLRKQVKMLVRQHMPLEPVDGLDGWSEVISARKAIELRDAALTECERLRHALTKIHDRCEAFVGDDSGMQVHSVEVLMGIAARGLGANK